MKIRICDQKKDKVKKRTAPKKAGICRAVTAAAAVSALAVVAVCADGGQVRISSHENVTGSYVNYTSLKNSFLESQLESFSEIATSKELVMEAKSVDSVLLNQDARIEAAVEQALASAQIELAKIESVVSEVDGSVQAVETQSDMQSEVLTLTATVVEEVSSAEESLDAAEAAVKAAAEEAAELAASEEAARVEAEEAAAAKAAEEAAAAEAAAKAAEEAAAAKAAEEAAAAKAAEEAAASQSTVTATYSSTVSNISDTDYNNLLRIVQAEAENQGDIGKILVANVILNRVKSSQFPNNITDVIFQSGQFSPVSNGRFYKVTVSESTKAAVDRALAGEDYSDGALYFVNYKSAKGWFNTLNYLFQYGDHVFYK